MLSANGASLGNNPIGDTGGTQMSNDTVSNNGSDMVIEDPDKRWDPTDESAIEYDSLADDRPTFTTAVKLVKIIVYLTTFCIVLVCGVVSKGTLLFMTSAIRRNASFSECNISGLDKGHKSFVQLSPEERFSWIWCLLFIFFLPELLTFFRSARLCIFKQYKKPKISSFVTVFFMESLHILGLFFLVFVVCPEMDALEALSLTNATCMIPAFLNMYSSWNSQNSVRYWMHNVLSLSALIGQISVFLWIITDEFDEHSESTLIAKGGAVVAVLLISCAWWENFVDSDSPNNIQNLKADIEKGRSFVYLFISIWKVVLIFTLVIIYLHVKGEDKEIFFEHLPFKSHSLTEIWSGLDGRSIPVTAPAGRTSALLPLIIPCIHIAASFLCYSCGKFVCKICIQGFSFALPILLTVPLTMALLSTACNVECVFKYEVKMYHFWKCPKDVSNHFTHGIGFYWLLWWVSQVWITIHLWYPKCERMASTNKLFVNPMYSSVIIDQSLALNRRRNEKEDSEGDAEGDTANVKGPRDIPKIFACATMWHETPDEMEQLLKSIMRMDVHQCSQKAIQDGLEIRNPDYYEMEVHIFFDDAFVVSDEDDEKMTINSFVKDLIVAVETAASKVYKGCAKIDPPYKIPTPYGGRLIWRLLGDNALVVHLKNKELIRHKKRWSQVMYMYYLLGYRFECCSLYRNSSPQNTFILALDGDIDFKPNAVQLLVDLMNRNKSLGAACGRIHPVGRGLMVYYQKFEYAIGHWLQKATEHMIGCVLCSPGCFSLFRAEALMKKNTIRRYAAISREAIEYVQFDQGEDRWLCTLLLQRGYRVEYSAASDAYTHCPESFAEFYTQRRRWAPSTLANIMDLLMNYKQTVECNDNISRLYIGYQMLLMIGTILGPGTIFLMLVGAMVTALGITNWPSFAANLVPIILYILICFYAKNDTQILVSEILSALYALLMMAVLVGMSLQMVEDGITSPSAIFILSMAASFIIAALAHPQEFWCVAHGLVYFLSVPSMYLLLALYSFANLHVVSWGTREVQTKKTKKQLEAETLQAKTAVAQQAPKTGGMFDWMHMMGGPSEEEGSISFGLANLFRCMCCTYPKPDTSTLHMVQVESHLKDMSKTMQSMQKQLEASTRFSGFRRRSSLQLQKDANLDAVMEDEDSEEEDIYEEQNDEPEEHLYNQPDNNEYWLTDPAVLKSPIIRLPEEEKVFWSELIETYLFPLADNKEEKAKVSRQLIELRNKVVFVILMINSLFILIVFLLQMQKETLHLEWPLGGKVNITYIYEEISIEMEYLQLEPINLVLVFFFTLILAIQFIAMLFHRLETLSHILASTNLIHSKDKDANKINFSQLTDMLQRQGLTDDEDEVESEMPDPQASSAPVKTVVDGPLPNGFADGGSMSGLRIREKPKFRSLSIALEKDLQKILESDRKFHQKVRRLSTNPAVLDALKRRTSAYNAGTLTRTPTPLDAMKAGIAALDSAFGTPPSVRRYLYIPSDHALDTASVHSIQMVDPSTIQPSIAGTSFASRCCTPVLHSSFRRNLEKIKEDSSKQEEGKPVI